MHRKNRVLWTRLLTATIPAIALWLLLPAVPFEWPSYTLWTCILLLPVLLVGLFRPMPALWLPDRRAAVRGLMATFVLGLLAWLWPFDEQRQSQSSWLLDKYMPRYDTSEHHTRFIRARPDQVWSALRFIAAEDITALRTLGDIRGVVFGRLPSARTVAVRRPILDSITGPGSPFSLLEVRPGEEIVMALGGRPWLNLSRKFSTPAEFLSYAEPDAVMVAFNFRVEPEGEFARLSTETRIRGTDTAGTRHFGRYWRFVYPGSSIIRTQMLNAVASSVSQF